MTCKNCGRSRRVPGKDAVFLYLDGAGREWWICGKRCMRAYNGPGDASAAAGDEISDSAGQPPSGAPDRSS